MPQFARAALTRRAFVGGLSAATAALSLRSARASGAALDVTFLVTSDVHACLMHGALAPKCQAEGKTDENLRRQIRAMNGLTSFDWPEAIAGSKTTFAGAGQSIDPPRGLVIAGDLTDDGGGQVAVPGEGTQLQQFSHRYQEGTGPDRVHFPVYVGLGNHDLDQDGPPANRDWYRREMRDYVEINYRPSVFYKPQIPVTNFDPYSDNYSWDWDDLHLVQSQRFAGDTRKGAISGLGWMRQDLETFASDGRPVILFQHYGWDPFSIGKWDPGHHRFDPTGLGPAQWWSDDERKRLLTTIEGFNVIGIFHGHQHAAELAYRVGAYDVFSSKAAFMGGFVVVRVTGGQMDVAFGEARPDGGVAFTRGFSKPIDRRRRV